MRLRAASLFAALSHRYRAASTRFDETILSVLTAATVRLESSPWADAAAVHRLTRWLRTHGSHHAASGLAGIVTQAEAESKQGSALSPHATRLVVAGARIGLVGAILLALWWVWPPFSDIARATQQAAQTQPTATPPFGLVNPANVLGSGAPPPRSAAPALVSQPAAIIVSSVITGVEEAADVPEAVLVRLPEVELTAQVQALRGAPLAALATEARSAVTATVALVPTRAAAQPTRDIPTVKILPAVGLKLSPTATPTTTPAPSPTPSPTPRILRAGRLWSNFQPRSAEEADHFWIERPFPSYVGRQQASPNYQFGSTAGNRYRAHHGIDISNPAGTPVRAGVAGTVVHAGWDDPNLLGPYGGFYGNAVVIKLARRLPVAGGELDVFVLYGHLSTVMVQVGEQVDVDDIVGAVGMTGIAIGPHLHVETRLGANTYEHSVNPYLWVRPTGQNGAVAVRLLTADGRTWQGARLTLARFEGSKAVWARQIEVYLDIENLGPDPAWGENGAMGSVPPGYYYLVGQVNGERIRTDLVVNPGQTTFVELRTTQ